MKPTPPNAFDVFQKDVLEEVTFLVFFVFHHQKTLQFGKANNK